MERDYGRSCAQQARVDVVRSFSELIRAQVYECLAYYEDHREEMDWLVAEQMAGPTGITENVNCA